MRNAASVTLGILLCAFLPGLADAGRENPRAFPNNTMCPIHMGWPVNEAGERQPSAGVQLREGLTFRATGRKAIISFVACEEHKRNEIDEEDVAIDVWLDDVAIIERTVYERYQVPSTPTGDLNRWCYFDDVDYEITVGSVFEPTAGPVRVRPFSRSWPFQDNFEDPVRTSRYWEFDGAEVQDRFGVGNVLVLAQARSGQLQCGMARLQVPRLVPDTEYVVDFKWYVTNIYNGIRPLITFIDTEP
jgi:hypothetical protein